MYEIVQTIYFGKILTQNEFEGCALYFPNGVSKTTDNVSVDFFLFLFMQLYFHSVTIWSRFRVEKDYTSETTYWYMIVQIFVSFISISPSLVSSPSLFLTNLLIERKLK